MNISELLGMARSQGCSDVHITMGRNPVFRKDGEMYETNIVLDRAEKENLILQMMDDDQRDNLGTINDLDFTYSSPNGLRHRVNVFHQQKELACVVRVINDVIPTMEALKLPEVLRQMCNQPRGLILVTGPTGSGKSTTLASMIDHVNGTRSKHILTIEDPVEYVYTKKRSVINQREVGIDVVNFSSALRSAMREDPDVILVGEMRDHETISAALTAAETGHLVLSTLHTVGAADTIDRIIDVFPAEHQQQIRTQLASTLKCVVTQALLPTLQTGRTAAFEIMLGTDAVLNLIRENKCHQLNSTIQTSAKLGMMTLDSSLATLVKQGIVSLDEALERAQNKEEFMTSVRM